MSKINPGTNFNEDNEVETARPGGLQETNIIEPKMDDKKKLHCPLCVKVSIQEKITSATLYLSIKPAS